MSSYSFHAPSWQSACKHGASMMRMRVPGSKVLPREIDHAEGAFIAARLLPLRGGRFRDHRQPRLAGTGRRSRGLLGEKGAQPIALDIREHLSKPVGHLTRIGKETAISSDIAASAQPQKLPFRDGR